MASSAQSPAQSQTVSEGDALNLFDLIQAHEAKATRLPPLEEIRTLLDRRVEGMLSTYSHKLGDNPSGSMVDFACDGDGSPILAISNITKDLLENPKCSLVVARDPEDSSDLLITLHGDAVAIPENDKEAVRVAYISKHPNSSRVESGDFKFMRIEPKVVRASGVTTEFLAEEFKAAKIDPIAQFSKPVASHMNRDHAEDTKVIVRHWTSIPVDSASILDIDSLGFRIKATCGGSNFKLRVPFPRPAKERKDLKALIVEMLHVAQAAAEAAAAAGEIQ